MQIQEQEYDFQHGRRMRLALLLLLLLTVAFSATTLVLKYKLEDLRSYIQAQMEERIGGRLQAESIRVNGLRGLRIHQLEAQFTPKKGPAFSIKAPDVYIDINLVDLLYGQLAIQQIQLDQAQLHVKRPDNQNWFSQDTQSSWFPDGFTPFGFRVIGKNCHLHIQNLLKDTHLHLEQLNFDVSTLSNAPDLRAKLTGTLSGTEKHQLQMDIRYASLNNFDVRIQNDALSLRELRPYLPDDALNLFGSGIFSQNIRIAGHPNDTFVISMEMPFEQLTFQRQPALLRPFSGLLTTLAHYNLKEHLLTLTTATARTGELTGSVEGTISFAEKTPHFALSLESDRLPINERLDKALQQKVEGIGELSLHLADTYGIHVGLQGTLEKPVFTIEAGVNAGIVHFNPKAPHMPRAELEFSTLKLLWDSETSQPTGSLILTNGVVEQKNGGLKAEKVNGTLKLEGHALTLEPFSAQIAGNPIVGHGQYNLDTTEGAFSLNGTLSEIENIVALQRLKKLSLAGAVNLRCDATITPNKCSMDASMELTQSQIEYDWWFRKTLGTGAALKNMHVELIPKKTMTITGDATIDTTQLAFRYENVYRDGHWRIEKNHVDANPVDVVSAGKCLRIPYTATGGVGTDGFFDLEHVADTLKGHRDRIGGKLDEVAFLAHGEKTPLRCKNVIVDVETDNSLPDKLTGTMRIDAEEASIPPFGEKWLLPLRPDDPELNAKFPPKTHNWTYELKAKKIALPPWQGENFVGTAFATPTETGLSKFGADIEGGHIEGNFKHEKADNIDTLAAKWNNVPAHYFIKHLKFSEMLSGRMNGEVEYSVDRDDPGTLKGKGYFEINDGRFSADFIFAQLEKQLGEK